jgi:hypothetical protein
MSEELERPITHDELGTLTQTITVEEQPLADGVPDPRPKVWFLVGVVKHPSMPWG